MKKVLAGVGILIAAALLYVLVRPSPIEPTAWTPPPAPALEGPYARNELLAAVDWFARGVGPGPEATAFDARGRIYTGLRDGRIIRFTPDGTASEVFANTGGDPLGIAFDKAGNLIVADVAKGLLSISPDGKIAVLATEHGGKPFRFTDDVDVAADGTIYFTDASSKWTRSELMLDVFEHGPNGRFLAYHPATGKTELLIDGLHFANGVAVAPDQSFVLVTETNSYRVLRYWRTGPKKGQSEPFIENLPGFPDNITASPEKGGRFWLALPNPRNGLLDALGPHPFLRSRLPNLPEALRPGPEHYAFVLGLDQDGKVIHNLQAGGPGCFGRVTSAREHGGKLYLGSVFLDSLVRIAAPE